MGEKLTDKEIQRKLSAPDCCPTCALHAIQELVAHIAAITEESNIMRTAANELRVGAAYWQGRALQAEAKNTELRDAVHTQMLRLYTIAAKLPQADYLAIKPIYQALQALEALSDDAVDTESVEAEVK